jgi:hypothetical protein
MGFIPQLAIVAPLLLLDLWYFAQLGRPPTTPSTRLRAGDHRPTLNDERRTRKNRARTENREPTQEQHKQPAAQFSILNSQFSILRVATGNLLSGALFLAVGLPLIAGALIYPRVDATTIPGMIGWSLAAALAFGWAGAHLGAWLSALDRPAEPAHASVWAGRVAAAALLAAVLFTTFFILTARPPIAA